MLPIIRQGDARRRSGTPIEARDLQKSSHAADTGDESRRQLRDHRRMTMHKPPEVPIRLFQTLLHACGYYPERQARSLVIDPSSPFLAQVYPSAIDHGFRRSGQQIYRPHCPACNACTPTRIVVDRFRPDRSQRRCLARNADLTVGAVPAKCSEENFALYDRYLGARHGDGPMAGPAPADFENFLIGSWNHTFFLEVRQAGRLLAIAVTDALPQGLSAVYTFYDPELSRRGLGTFAILQQIAWATERGLPFVYLGYWLAGHPKMDYKRRFSGLEVLREGRWQDLA